MSNSTTLYVKLLTTAAMVDHLAEKVDECPLNWGHSVLLAYNWDRKNSLLGGVARCPLFRGCLSIQVNGRTVGTLKIVISRVSAFQGCPLRGVPLYFSVWVQEYSFPILTIN